MDTITIVLGVLVGLVGSGGIIYGALRFNRDEADRIVRQQAQILEDMKSVYEVVKNERDALLEEVVGLRKEIRSLRRSMRETRDANAR